MLCSFSLAGAQEPSQPISAQEIANTLRDKPQLETLMRLMPAINNHLRSDEMAPEIVPVVEQAALLVKDQFTGEVHQAIAAHLLLSAARWRFELAETDKAKSDLELLQQIERAIGEQLPAERRQAHQSRWSHEIVLAYLRGGELEAALKVLGENLDANPSPMEGSDSFQAAAAGSLNRRLEQLSTNEQFEILRAWTRPAGEPRRARDFSSIASIESPPDVFARALGERPRNNAFPVPSIGNVDGIFSTAWRLAKAASETGQSKKLINDLSAAVKEDAAASHLLLLAKIADPEIPSNELLSLLDDRIQRELAKPIAPQTLVQPAPGQPIARLEAPVDPIAWLVLGAACLERSELRVTGQRVFELLAARRTDAASSALIPFARRARAIAIMRQHEGTTSQLLVDPGLKDWIPASEESATASARGAVRETWLEHEDHIVHLAGPGNDYLFYRYPLTGDFQFDVEAQSGGPEVTSGNIAFGGLAYFLIHQADEFRVSGLGGGLALRRPFPFIRKEDWPTYQRLTLRSTAEGTEYIVNGHPVWKDDNKDATSPWLALRCSGDALPAFRNFKFSGKPNIPREVHLSKGSQLRGWSTQFYPGVADPSLPLPTTGIPYPGVAVVADAGQPASGSADPIELDWSLRDGVIHGAFRNPLLQLATPSRLTYYRPLQNSESLTYEFFYDPGKQEVHPSIGRLAFLLEPTGVRVRWLTSGDDEWTGLSVNHATVEPLNRRGPRTLPLKTGDWNRVTLTVADDAITLTLNEAVVYSRKLEPTNSRRFGFYHDRSRSAAQVRNVVLTGEWPQTLTEEQKSSLLQKQASHTSDGGSRVATVISSTLDDCHIVDSTLDVLRRAANLTAEERFSLLLQHVLPSSNRERIRVTLDFTPTHPPPVADVLYADASTESIERSAGHSDQSTPSARLQTGGELVSPAIALIEVARQLKRLDVVRSRVQETSPKSELEERQKFTLLAMVDQASGDFVAANESFTKLFGLIEFGRHTQFQERWPETVAAHAALQHEPTRQIGRELAVALHLKQARHGAPSGSEAWRRHIATLVGLARYWLEDSDSGRGFPSAPPLKQWTPVEMQTSRTRGSGYPRSHWHLRGAELDVFSRHHHDYLYFQSPLRGNYEIECDLPAFGWRDSQVLLGGEWVAARFDLKSYSIGQTRGLIQHLPIARPLIKPTDWIHYRIVARDGLVRTYVNGRLLHERTITDEADPWLGIGSETPGNGGAKDMWISGQPTIPESIELPIAIGLNGWFSYYDYDRLGSGWKFVATDTGPEIVAPINPTLAGMNAESLLRYHRPMLEDGEIEYEFFYEPEKSHCHLALDRLVFLLEPSGVRLHWLTDGSFDRTALGSNNMVDEPQRRRGPVNLPLKPGEWNHLAVSLEGQTVTLTLNGVVILEREIEVTNQRTFGFFHYADQSEVRVRKIAWRGKWPRELPAIEQQELAGGLATFLDITKASLAGRFEHRFSESFPPNKFSVIYGGPEAFEATHEGLRIEQAGAEGYRNVTFAPRLSIEGDFDITADFEHFEGKPSNDATVSLMLTATLADPPGTEATIMRRHSLPKRGLGDHFHQSAVVLRDENGERRSYSRGITSENTAGRLRLARRGSKVYFLFAEGDSPRFRLTRVEELGTGRIDEGHLRLLGQTKGPGQLDVVWSSLSIHAEKLAGFAATDLETLVAKLDTERAGLTLRLEHDFRRQRFDSERFLHWGFDPMKAQTSAGLVVSGPPRDEWSSAGMSLMQPLTGDFDISFEFNLLRLTPPKSGSSAIYLQLEAPDELQRQFSSMLVGSPDGARFASAQLRDRTAEGKLDYVSLGREFDGSIRRLRLARRGSEIFYLYGRTDSNVDRLVARHPITSQPIPAGNVRLLVHTEGSDAVTEIACEKLVVHSSK